MAPGVDSRVTNGKMAPQVDEPNLKRTLEEFADKTSVLGISFIRRSENRLWQVVYSIFMLGGLTIALFTIATLTQKFLKKESTTLMSKSSTYPEFPTVTICNLNRVRRSMGVMVDGSHEFKNLFNQINRVSQSPYSEQDDLQPSNANCGCTTPQPTESPVGTPVDLESDGNVLDQNLPVLRIRRAKDGSSPPDSMEMVGAESIGLSSEVQDSESSGKVGRTRSKRSVDDFINQIYQGIDAGSTSGSPGPGGLVDETAEKSRENRPACPALQSEGSRFSAKADVDRAFRDSLAKLPRKIREKIGHQRSHMILSCVYNDHVCSARTDFVETESPDYGNCFAFNGYSESNSEKKTVFKAGPNAGLDLMLFIERAEYLDLMTDGFGIRVDVHDKGTRPFLSERGMSVAPGQSAQISLTQSKVILIGEPYTPCIDGKKRDSSWPKYNFDECANTCPDVLIAKYCKCKRPSYEAYYTHTQNLTICGKDHSTCLEKALNDAYCPGCDCKPACREQKYTPSTSSHTWPTLRYWEPVGGHLKLHKMSSYEEFERISNTSDSKRKLSFLQDNSINLKIFLSEIGQEVFTETEVYQASQFISDICGNVGIWIGASFLTLVELVDLIAHVLMTLCAKKKSRVKTAGAVTQVNENLAKKDTGRHTAP